jgi:ABC-type transporter Mla subunit MlaD
MPRAKVINNAFPVGLFILIALLLVVGGILWLRDFSLRPQYTFTVMYKRPARLASGGPVYFRGVQIGRIENVALATDSNSTNVTMGVFKHGLLLPKTVRIHIREELLSGQPYIEIVPREQTILAGGDYIHNGDMLTGIEPVNMDKLEEQIGKIAEHHGLDKLVDATRNAMINLGSTSEEVKRLGIDSQQFLHRTEGPTNLALNQFTETSRHVSVMAGRVGTFSNSTQGQLSRAIPKIVAASQQFVSNTNKVPQTLDAVGSAADQTKETLSTLNTQLVQSSLLMNLSSTLSGLNQNLFPSLTQTSDRIDCTTAQASHIMAQRFPGFKIFFGKPGDGYSCDKSNFKPISLQAGSSTNPIPPHP